MATHHGGCTGCLAKLLLICSGIVLAVYLFSSQFGSLLDDPLQHAVSSAQTVTSSQEHQEPVSQPQDTSALSYYETLTESDRAIYDELYNAVQSFENYTYTAEHFGKYSDAVKERLFTILQYVLYDHPEIFWVSASGSITFDGLRTYVCEPDYYFTADEAASYTQQLTQQIDSITADVNAQSDYEKVIWAYEWIIRNTTYDHALANSDDMSPASALERSAYGCFLQGKTICSGYAQAFQLLMQHFGIPCTYLSGIITDNGGRHAWNLVMINGNCYHVDPTWGDPAYNGAEADDDSVSYSYLCLTDAQIKRTRTISEDGRFPAAEDTQYNYYLYHDLYIDSVSDEAIRRIVQNAVDTGERMVSMQFAGDDLLNQAVETYINQQRIYTIISGLPRQLIYSIDSSNDVLSIWLQ